MCVCFGEGFLDNQGRGSWVLCLGVSAVDNCLIECGLRMLLPILGT